MRNAELENQLGALDKEMKFKIQLLETEIQEEKNKNKFDFNTIERKLQNDYENRFLLIFYLYGNETTLFVDLAQKWKV